jgi:hypothetical protein
MSTPILSRILGKAGKTITQEISKTIDVLSTSDAEKLEHKEKLTSAVMTQLALVNQAAAGIILAEAQGNWMQRSWRPILMLNFGFIITYRYFLSPVFGWPSIDMPEKFWTLLEIGMGGYVVGRSIEKIADKVTRNVDLTFLKKKDRKELIEE